jgi:DNA/RNA-binding domain of Phe-tRNA-synthetase-like protein
VHYISVDAGEHGAGRRPSRPGLPRIDRLTDIYNAMSVKHLLPIGGEDRGPARLVRAAGDEPFDTIREGQPVTEHPEPGEVVWRDVGLTNADQDLAAQLTALHPGARLSGRLIGAGAPATRGSPVAPEAGS